MSGKAGLAIGLLVGVIIAVVAAFASMHFMTGKISEEKAAAYDEGYKAAQDDILTAGGPISSQLNQGALEANEQLHQTLDTTRTRLQAFQSRDDLTPAAKDELANIVAGLPE